MWRQLMTLGILFVGACSPGVPNMMDRPSAEYVYSKVQVDKEGEIIVAATFSGGAAGDTTYKLFACPTGKARCEVLASIGENGSPRPEVSMSNGKIVLTISENHGLSGFRNFTRLFTRMIEGSIRLNYRQ